MTSPRIVVGVDGSPEARSALLWAADEAALHGCGLLVLHAARPADGATGQALLNGQVALASARQPAVPVTMLLSDTPATAALVELGQSAQLLVVGTRDRSDITTSLLGSVSHRTAAHARCPVAVVPGRSALPRAGEAPVVLGFSDGPAGRAALEFAADEAARRGASLHIVLAPPVQHPNLDQVRGRHPDLHVDAVVADDEPAEALLRAARQAQLLVIGCHHSEDPWATRLGPVPAAVLHRAACPVIVVGAGLRRPVTFGRARLSA